MQSPQDAFSLAAALLNAHPDYRVTCALPPLDTLMLPEAEGKTYTALVVDTETTSLDWKTGKIIQIAACPVTFDTRARIVAIGETRSWLQDPGESLLPQIGRLTGLTDADLAGQRIDDFSVEQMLADANVVVAHNAKFDRPWWQARYPLAYAKPWACSLAEVGWREHGFEGRSLGILLDQAGGWFNARHRADADVNALVALLTVKLPPGHTVAAEMLLTAGKPTLRISASGAPYAVKDALRLRGYRWQAADRIWQRDVAEADHAVEVAWLAAEAESFAPKVERITWFERYR
jgi:DNA polymerase-3 subunit epsilon